MSLSGDRSASGSLVAQHIVPIRQFEDATAACLLNLFRGAPASSKGDAA